VLHQGRLLDVGTRAEVLEDVFVLHGESFAEAAAC
jgi:hypothetical protein